MTRSDRPRTPYLGSYILIYVGTILAVIVTVMLVRAIFAVDIGNAGTAILPPIAAALLVGQRWARAAGAVPPSPEIWRFAIVAAVAAFALMVLAALASLAALGPDAGDLAPYVGGIVLLFTALTVLLNRWFVMLGARMALRAG